MSAGLLCLSGSGVAISLLPVCLPAASMMSTPALSRPAHCGAPRPVRRVASGPTVALAPRASFSRYDARWGGVGRPRWRRRRQLLQHCDPGCGCVCFVAAAVGSVSAGTSGCAPASCDVLPLAVRRAAPCGRWWWQRPPPAAQTMSARQATAPPSECILGCVACVLALYGPALHTPGTRFEGASLTAEAQGFCARVREPQAAAHHATTCTTVPAHPIHFPQHTINPSQLPSHLANPLSRWPPLPRCPRAPSVSERTGLGLSEACGTCCALRHPISRRVAGVARGRFAQSAARQTRRGC
jgi:hypothetical protein